MESLIKKIISGRFVLIAEIGVNYYDIAAQQNIPLMNAAKLMCFEAAKAGADAVKFQTYKAETLAVKESPSYWDTSEETTTSQYQLFKKYDSFGEPEYKELSDYCKEIGIVFCSTAFDFNSADYLDGLMDVFKISSSDLTNIPFIRYQASKGKPIILSVGAGNLEEINEAVDAITSINEEPLTLMHCVLEYPTPYNDANLSRISTLKSEFPDAIIGYSDHCRPDASYDVIKTAFALGANVIEKHFTLDKQLPGNDHYHAMDPSDIRGIIEGVKHVRTLMGSPELCYSEGEEAARSNARRSIVAARSIAEGELISEDAITFKRPGTGISPSDIDKVIGRKARQQITEDSQIMENMLF